MKDKGNRLLVPEERVAPERKKNKGKTKKMHILRRPWSSLLTRLSWGRLRPRPGGGRYRRSGLTCTAIHSSASRDLASVATLVMCERDVSSAYPSGMSSAGSLYKLSEESSTSLLNREKHKAEKDRNACYPDRRPTKARSVLYSAPALYSNIRKQLHAPAITRLKPPSEDL